MASQFPPTGQPPGPPSGGPPTAPPPGTPPGGGDLGQPPDGGGKRGRKKAEREAKAREATLSGRRTRLFAMLGIFLAAAAGLLTLSAGEEDADTVYALVANEAIGAMTAVHDGQFDVVEVDSELVPESAVSAVTEAEVAEEITFDGAYTRHEIRPGSWVYPEMFGEELAGELNLEPEERLVTIRADAAGALAGRLRAGDRVDVVSVETNEGLASLVASDMEIVSADVEESILESAQQSQSGEAAREASREELLPADPIPGIYTLRGDTQLINELILTESLTDLYLVYRGGDAEDQPSMPVDLMPLLCTPYDPDDVDLTVDLDTIVDLPEACQGVLDP